jgi:Na+-translocating ferredoxin:NAD+ oxidoreductase RnfA subunit
MIDIMVYVIWPQPSDVTAWFSLFHESWIVGLLDLDFLGMIIYIIVIPAILALYLTLRRTSRSWAAVGGVLTLVGMATYFASNTSVSMLSLSGQYAAATTDAQRAIFLAAGQAVLAIFFGPAFTTSFCIVSAALLTTAIVMLRSPGFRERVAYVGIIANVAGLGEQLPVPIAVTMVIGLVNAIGLGIWFILVGRRLWQLGQDGNRIETNRK